ncbi:MAG TPA: type II secretion system F family protein [Micromonosporaceae bacterium]|jgi:tight adherence protein B
MSRLTRGLVGLVALVAPIALLWATPATAEPPKPALVVSQVHTDPGRVSFLVTPTNVGLDSTVDVSTLTVQAEGVSLPARVQTAADLTGAPTRLLMVVLDGGDRYDQAGTYFAAARQAATALADTVPADVALGLFVIGPDGAKEALQPTTDRSAYRAAVAAAKRGGTWDPVDGVDGARAAVLSDGLAVERRVLLISDGVNAFTSDFDSKVGGALATSQVGLDIVAFRASGTGLTGLQRIADAAGGRLLKTTDAASVSTAAQGSGRFFAPTLSVTAAVPSSLSGLTAVVTVDAAGFASVQTTVPFAMWDDGLAAASPPLAWVPGWLVYVVALFLFAAVVALVLALAWPRSQSHALIKKIAHFGPRRSQPSGRAAPLDAASAGARITQTVLAASATVVRAGGLEQRIALRLEQAGMKLRPHEWVAICASIAVGASLILAIVGGIPGFVLGLALGAGATLAYRMARVSRRRRSFTEQLPDGLQLVIGSLRAGFSLGQALESLVRESPEPLAAEFGRAVAEHRLGSDLSDALDRLAARVGSEDLTWAVMAVRIQRDVGGNLADVLQTSVDTMREREQLNRHIRALSAEGRLSAWILAGVPVFLAVFMGVFRRAYLMPLFTDPRGLAMSIVAVVLFAVGVFWMTRVVRTRT